MKKRIICSKGYFQHIPSKKRRHTIFLQIWLSKYVVSSFPYEVVRCARCGSLLKMPIQYDHGLIKVIYFVSSAWISNQITSFFSTDGVFLLLGKLLTWILIFVCTIGGAILFDGILTAAILYFCKWGNADILLMDERMIDREEKKRFEKDQDSKLLAIGLGIGVGFCLTAENLILTIIFISSTIVGLFLRFLVQRIKR